MQLLVPIFRYPSESPYFPLTPIDSTGSPFLAPLSNYQQPLPCPSLPLPRSPSLTLTPTILALFLPLYQQSLPCPSPLLPHSLLHSPSFPLPQQPLSHLILSRPSLGPQPHCPHWHPFMPGTLYRETVLNYAGEGTVECLGLKEK